MKSSDAFAIDAAYERYKHECAFKYADDGPGGAFRIFDKAKKSASSRDDLPYDADFPQIVICDLFGPDFDALRYFALAGFGAPYGLFAPMDAIQSRLASQIIKSWIKACSLALVSGHTSTADEAEFSGFTWHLEINRDGNTVSGPKLIHTIVDDLAGFTVDGQPVLRDSQASTSLAPKGPSNGNSLTVTLCNGCTQSSFLHDLRPAYDRAF